MGKYEHYHQHEHIKILFVLKKRNYDKGVSYGLKTSCNLVATALEKYGIDSKIVEVFDGNCIDREVYHYKPTHVFLEAFWVEPKKVKELLKLYPKIHFYVRIHSKIPFLAHEGMSVTWIYDYAKIDMHTNNFNISFNNKQAVRDFEQSMGIKSVYAPNIYLFNKLEHVTPNLGCHLRIGCFGANRELKNALNQALAAIEFADENDFLIEFHINVSSVEKGGEGIVKNLRSLFRHSRHRLVEWSWMSHSLFLELVKTMDLGMTVSFSESFCIVAADFVSQNIPIVGSKEIEFLNHLYVADPSDVTDIKRKLSFAYYAGFINLQRLNEYGLHRHNERAIKEWLELLHVCKYHNE